MRGTPRCRDGLCRRPGEETTSRKRAMPRADGPLRPSPKRKVASLPRLITIAVRPARVRFKRPAAGARPVQRRASPPPRAARARCQPGVARARGRIGDCDRIARVRGGLERFAGRSGLEALAVLTRVGLEVGVQELVEARALGVARAVERRRFTHAQRPATRGFGGDRQRGHQRLHPELAQVPLPVHTDVVRQDAWPPTAGSAPPSTRGGR